MLDTLVWLANFPASHAFEVLFIVGFSMLGVIGLSRKRTGTQSRLLALRVEAGLAAPGSASPTTFVTVRAWFFRVIGILMVISGIIAALSEFGVPVTRAYIHNHGVTAPGTIDGDWVTFTAQDGRTYTLENNFFSPSVYPDTSSILADEVTVHYLPSHPQAYVVHWDKVEYQKSRF